MYGVLVLLLVTANPIAAPYKPIAAPYAGEIKIEAAPVVKHTGQPITQPKKLRHTLRESGCTCAMCLGSHLINAHGLTLADWDRLKLGTNHAAAMRLHREEHRRTDPPITRGCGPGGCSPGRRVLRFPRLFRW